MTIPTAIRELRNHRKLTQEHLAREIGSTLKTISRYENGSRPTRLYLTRLAASCGDRDDLRAVFLEAVHKQISTSVASLGSRGAARRIGKSELVELRDLAKDAIDQLTAIVERIDPWL